MNRNNLLIHASNKPTADQMEYEVVERKGLGHPDTLCDTLAEKISGAYSLYCLERYGIILRHMVDKIALAGGSTRVKFGGGEMAKPIRFYLNCRFTRTYQRETIPYFQIVRKTTQEHFNEVMPLLDLEQWFIIVDNTHSSPGPGVVYTNEGSTPNERQFFFEVPQKDFVRFHDNGLRSNDTSTTVAYYPLSKTEEIVLLVENMLNGKEFKKEHLYVGTDIKVMAQRIRNRLGITACVPFISSFTPNEGFYNEKLRFLSKLIREAVTDSFGQFEVSVELNTRDNPANSDYYLTLTGSALESGDEGVVGRGNRYNGVIPFTRHMSMEACCGKNPVYHVGKLYTAIGFLISKEIHETLGLETYVYLTSQMGRALSDPWAVSVEVCKNAITEAQKDIIETVVEKNLVNASVTTGKIVRGEIKMF